MTTPFDPYRKWLGIPPQYQPPNHYRLLGIELFESDPDVIAHAADQRAVHLKSFAAGPNSALSQKLLNEVAAARICLLNAAEKQRYDAQLRLTRPGNGPAGAEDDAPLSVVNLDAPPTAPSRRLPPAPPRVIPPAKTDDTTERGSGKLLLAIAAGVTVLLTAAAIVAAVFVFGPGRDEGKQLAQQVANETDGSAKSTENGEGTKPIPPVKPKSETIDGDGSKTDPASPPAETPSEGTTDVTTTRPEVPPVDPPVKPKPIKGGKPPKVIEPKPAEPPPEPKAAPPDKDYVEKTEKDLLEVYKDKLQQANSPEGKRAMAKEMAALANDAKSDKRQQYVVLRFAANLAAEGEDLDESLGTIDRIAAGFDVDVYELKAATLTRVNKASRVPPALNVKLGSAAQRLAEEARSAGSVGAMIDLVEVLSASSRRAKIFPNTALEKAAKEWQPLREKEQLAKLADERLRQEPANAKANLASGAWECFVRDDWQRGLPRLAKSGDAALAALAASDLANPKDAAGQLAVAEGWWALSKEKSGIERTRLQARAADWYFKAAKQAGGLELVKLLKELDDKGLRVRPKALRFNGQNSIVLIKDSGYDGKYPITIEAIVQPTFSEGARGAYGILGNLCDSVTGLSLLCSPTEIDFVIAAGTTRQTQLALFNPRDARLFNDRWLHVAGVYDGAEVCVFVDGAVGESRAVNGPFKPSIVPFMIGAVYHQRSTSSPPEPSAFFRGLARGVRVSRGVRYAKEFKPPTEFTVDSATMMLFNMSEGKGLQLKDASNHKLFGTIIGCEWVELAPEMKMPALH